MYIYHLYLVLKQRTFWCVVKQHMKIRVKSEDIDLHTLSVLKQHTCFYSVKLNNGAFSMSVNGEPTRVLHTFVEKNMV